MRGGDGRQWSSGGSAHGNRLRLPWKWGKREWGLGSWNEGCVTVKDRHHPLEGFGIYGVAGNRRGRGIVEQGEGNCGESTKESAEKAAGVAIADAAGPVGEESIEDVEGFGGDFPGFESDEVAFQFAPVEEEGAGGGAGALVPAGARGEKRRLRCVLTAEDVTGRGTAAATLPVGKSEAAFHRGSLHQQKSPAGEARLFHFLL